jgi:hypothetical protein
MTDIVLGGRIFAPANFDRMTSLQECHVMKLLRASGLDRIMPAQDDSDAAWLAKLNAAVVDCDHLHELVGTFLLPLGKTERDWTRETAADTCRFLEQIDTPDDRAKVHELGMEVTYGFFVHGLELLKRSQSALEKAERSSPPSSPTNPTPLPVADASTSAPGPLSSEWWRALTSPRARKSPAGRSASS